MSNRTATLALEAFLGAVKYSEIVCIVNVSNCDF